MCQDPDEWVFFIGTERLSKNTGELRWSWTMQHVTLPVSSVTLSLFICLLIRNTTSHTQPMDQGNIANFKRHYDFHYTMKLLLPAAESGKKQSWSIRQYFICAVILIKTKLFQNEVLKVFVVLWRYMVFQISLHFACFFESISGDNGPVSFDLTNVERGLWSNF